MTTTVPGPRSTGRSASGASTARSDRSVTGLRRRSRAARTADKPGCVGLHRQHRRAERVRIRRPSHHPPDGLIPDPTTSGHDTLGSPGPGGRPSGPAAAGGLGTSEVGHQFSQYHADSHYMAARHRPTGPLPDDRVKTALTIAVAIICILNLLTFWRLAVDADNPGLLLDAVIVYCSVLVTHGLWRAEQHAVAFRWSSGVVTTIFAAAFLCGTDATPSTIVNFWILTLTALVYDLDRSGSPARHSETTTERTTHPATRAKRRPKAGSAIRHRRRWRCKSAGPVHEPRRPTPRPR